jgi:MFS family permease
MWAIPYQLFLPFASLYMSALGLTDAGIGAVAALGLAAQFLWALLSGAIVDKIGRRRSMLVFGLLSWTIPCALWAGAQSFAVFALAALLNGMWRVTGTSFSCLIVEDGDDEKLVHIFTILSIIGLAAGFLSPVAGLFMARFSLAPTMRALYALALALMTVKFILHYRMSVESTVGRARMAECRGNSLLALAFGGFDALVSALKGRRFLLCAALAVLLNCDTAIRSSFWPLFMTEKYGQSAAAFSVLPPVKSAVTFAAYLLIAPRVRLSHVRRPLLGGLAAGGLSLGLLLAFLPMGFRGAWIVFPSAACDALALALLGPFVESLISVSIPRDERARVNSMLTAGILLASAPLTWLAGLLAETSRTLPLFMGVCFLAAEVAVALLLDSAVRAERVQA